jgi:hypothetical protein
MEVATDLQATPILVDAEREVVEAAFRQGLDEIEKLKYENMESKLKSLFDAVYLNCRKSWKGIPLRASKWKPLVVHA